MKKLILSLSILAAMPAFGAIPSQNAAEIATPEEVQRLRAENAQYKKQEALQAAKKENDEKLFIEHRNAIIKNGTLITAGAVLGVIGTFAVLAKCLPIFTK